MSELAWHYTTGECFKLIVESGAILPATVGISKKEKPVIWFSLAEFWEPTASKGMMQNGKRVDMGMEGTYLHGGGLARLGVSPAKLVPWPELARKANIPPLVRVELQKTAASKGSDPKHWLGIVKNVFPLVCVEAIDVYDGKQWERIQGTETKSAAAGK